MSHHADLSDGDLSDADLSDARTRLLTELRRQGIRDERVLDVIGRTPRERFLPTERRPAAYDNRAVPIGLGQTISQPYIVALTTAALDLRPSDRVLEIGTGSGYQTAILAQLARHVYTIERFASLSTSAQANLDQVRVHNVSFRVGDGCAGWPEEAPFDRIVVTAAAPKVTVALKNQLADQGVMVIPVGDESAQQLIALMKQGHLFQERVLCDCRFVPLIGEGAWPEDVHPT